MVLWPEMPRDDASEYRRKHDAADGHVKAVETGQHEECRTIGAGREPEVEFPVGMAILEDLEAEEGEAQGDRRRHPQDELGSLVPDQRPVGKRHRDPG